MPNTTFSSVENSQVFSQRNENKKVALFFIPRSLIHLIESQEIWLSEDTACKTVLACATFGEISHLQYSEI